MYAESTSYIYVEYFKVYKWIAVKSVPAHRRSDQIYVPA